MAYGQKILKGDAYKRAAIKRRHIRIRKNLSGTAERPRLVVTRSNRHIVAQVIDDLKGHTLCVGVHPGHLDPWRRGADKSAQARQVGALVAERAKAARCRGRGLRQRWRNQYAGRIAALADATPAKPV